MRINGQSFDIRMAAKMVHVENFSLTIEDNSTTAKNKGVPNGSLRGDVSASGEIELDIAQFMILSGAVAAFESWQDLPPFDINVYATGSNGNQPEAMHVIAHGCKIKISDLLSIDPNSTDKSTVKLPYDVTGSDFVHINGVPYVPGTRLNLI